VRNPTQLGPLTYVCAAPGTGKSTVLPALIAMAQGEIVIDNDELLEDGALIGVPIATPSARPVWPAYDRMWRGITTIVRRAGHPVIMLSQVPDAQDIDREADDPAVHWLGWDCPDDVRIRRLQGRRWTRAQVDDALADARQCRRLILDRLTTDDTWPGAEIARTILERTRHGLSRDRSATGPVS